MLAAVGAAALMGGCSQLSYFVQAAQGQYSLLHAAKPIDDWLTNPEVSDKLKVKLSAVQEIRKFAVQELALPDNSSYTTYADLKRPYVLWNVVAAPELSLEPKKWCFPVAGCVSYRGYYNKDDALAYATELRSEHYDVQVGGVPAYSTLGFFSDPVLSTFIQYPEGELARIVFHELAHQVVYVAGDSRFNESFAVSVEEAGVERWMATHGNDKMRKAYADYEGRKKDFLALLTKCREELEENYASDASDAEKKKRKAEVFRQLKEEYQTLKVSWGGYAGYDRWFEQPLSNAHLAAIATYQDFVPAFRALLAKEKTFPKFYEAVKKLAAEDKATREQELQKLQKQAALPDV
jgi:predicted aminopeptidase